MVCGPVIVDRPRVIALGSLWFQLHDLGTDAHENSENCQRFGFGFTKT